MYSLGRNHREQFRMVIENKGNPCGPSEGVNLVRQRSDRLYLDSFGTQLQKIHSSGQQLLCRADDVFHREIAQINNPVEPGSLERFHVAAVARLASIFSTNPVL